MPTLNERAVINLGQGSYVITLPKAWLRYFGIKPGDRLEVITNGELIIRPPRQRECQSDHAKLEVYRLAPGQEYGP